METTMFLRQPHSAEAEQSVIGSVLIKPDTISIAISMLKPDDFYVPENKKIFEILSDMFTSGIQIDPITVLNRMKEKNLYDEAGGRAYLTKIMETTPSAVNIEAYAEIVKDKAKLRSIATATSEANARALTEAGSVDEQIEIIEQRMYEIRGDRLSQGPVSIKSAVNDTINETVTLSKEGGKIPGIPTGFPDLDNYISGLNKSDLIILAARPGIGKTAFALNIARYAAEAAGGKNVLIFNLEMSRVQLVQRMLSAEAQVPMGRIKTASLSADEWSSLTSAAIKLGNLPIYIDDQSDITVAEIKARTRRVQNVGLLVIDYLQLIHSTRKDGNQVQAVADMSRSLKILAKELNIPVLCLSQLSRAPEQRKDDNKPKLSDLRDSGAIEQDADIVMFLYRDAQYHPEKVEAQNKVDLIIAKNRHGECRTVEFNWQGEFTRFTMRDTTHEKP